MNQEAQDYLDEILKLSPSQLTEDQIGFLRARRDYLKESQKEEYKSVLNQTSKKETVNKNEKQTK